MYVVSCFPLHFMLYCGNFDYFSNLCAILPNRSSYNTTAPLYGVSLTSGQPVTIVQKFPDLLQQVIYETCE